MILVTGGVGGTTHPHGPGRTTGGVGGVVAGISAGRELTDAAGVPRRVGDYGESSPVSPARVGLTGGDVPTASKYDDAAASADARSGSTDSSLASSWSR